MDWINYYTPRDITKKLLNHIPKEYSPSHIIDICGGSGNMLIEGSLKYPKAKVTYLDKSVDKQVKNTYQKSWRIFKNDSTCNSTLKYFKTTDKKLLLANPPFGYSEKKESIFKISNRLEIQILDINISLLKNGDIFAAVLPENIFTSENALDFRNHLMNNFEVIYKGRPKKYFKASEVLTRLFVGRKVDIKKTRKPRIRLVSNDLILERGIDNSLLNSKANALLPEIKIVHGNKLENNSTFYCSAHLYKNKPIIRRKDLLIVRVGRNAGKVIYTKTEILGHGISDNLMLLRDHKILKKEVLQLEQILINSKKGLTTKYITKNDVFQAVNMTIKNSR